MPMIGFRLRLQARGSGLWERSGGVASKFGLTTRQLLACLDRLQEAGLGQRVSLLHFHHPAHVANRIAMLDHLAKGRLYFGIGSGGGPSDLEMFDIDTEAGSPRERMMECVEAVIRLWDEGPFDYDGRFFKMNRPEDRSHWEVGFHMRPYQQPHPPLRIAANTAETFTRLGNAGHPIFVGLRGMDVPELRRNVDEYRRSWREAGSF